MYKLIYTVPFTNVDGLNYVIQILEEGGSGTPVELTGGTPPFIVEYNDEDFLYTPTRFSGATLKLVGSDYLQRLFSTQYQKFKVNLLKGSSVMWTGFITPEVYSQDFDNSLFELEIECISALSTLEYIDFSCNSDLISLKEIISKCINESKGDFEAVYLPKTYSVDLNQIKVSKANFFDEEGKAMKLKECLEEVCKFLNWTVTEFEGSVYFIDLDYIQKGNTVYTNLLNGSNVNLSSTINLRTIPSKGGDNTLSILGGYNKVVVVDSDYEADTDKMFPDLEWSAIGGINKVEKAVDTDKDKKVDRMFVKYWCDYNPDFKFYNYKWDGSKWVTVAAGDKNLAGVYPVKTTDYSIPDLPNSLTYIDELEFYQADNITLDPINALYEDGKLHKMLEISDSFNSKPIIVDSDYKFTVNFQIARCVTPERLIYKVDQIDGNEDLESIYLPIAFNIGDYWYNGSSWLTNECTFDIEIPISQNNLKNTYINCKDTNDFTYNVPDLKGWLIHVNRVLIGKPKITIYNPKDHFLMKNFLAISYFLKDFEIQCQKIGSSSLNGKKEKQDTKYENTVNEEYINQCDDIEFKITSKNDSELSFSKAMYNGAILDKLQNNITNTEMKPEELLINRIVNQYKQPKIKLLLIIQPSILPYSKVTDPVYMAGKTFILTGGTIDYEDNKFECNLIELK